MGKLLRFAGYILGISRASGKGETVGNNQSKRIATVVTAFVNDHIGREFTAKELRFHVVGRVDKAAPASADRIMRQLRKEGKLNYKLVSRVQSLYKGLAVDNYNVETGKFATDTPAVQPTGLIEGVLPEAQ